MKVRLVFDALTRLFRCPRPKTKFNATSIDDLEHQAIYFALPLGMDLDQYKAMYNLKNYLSEIDSRRLEYIDFACVVIAYPSSEQIEKLSMTKLPVDHESIEVNRRHEQVLAKMIQSFGLRTEFTPEQFIYFKGDRGSWDLDVRKDKIPDWKFILFKKDKEPTLLPNVLVTREEVEHYFEI
jgi:hypothetical protein